MVTGRHHRHPGLGLAAGQVGLARVLAGLPLTTLTEQLVARLATLPPPGVAPSVTDQGAALELAVLARTGPATDLPARIAALGGWLGAGLKGHPVRELPVDTMAHLAAVFAGLSEEVSTGLRRQWRCTGHELGRWTRLRCSPGWRAPRWDLRLLAGRRRLER